MHRLGFFVIACMMLVAGVRDASAQVGPDWIDRGYLNLNVGFESGSGTLTDAASVTVYGEPGTTTVQQATDSGAFFDVSVGARVWRNVSFGIGFHRGSSSGNASVQASVPNPLLFDAHRAVAANADDLSRTEQAVHLQVGYMLLVTEELSVHVTAGPSIFRLRQDVVGDLSYQEGAFPFTTVTAVPVIEERSDSAAGVNVGVDVAYKVYDSDAYRIGAGIFLRWAGATGTIRVVQNEVDSDLGGVQLGLGARLRF